jgi:hypothetical protein
MATLLGREPINDVFLTPSEFGELLVQNKENGLTIIEQMSNGGAFAEFNQDQDYPIKNAPLGAYVKHIVSESNYNVTLQENVTVNRVKAIKVFANGTNEFSNIKFIEYLLIHDKDPYHISYMAHVKDFDKYLPDFEQMVKSFRIE